MTVVELELEVGLASSAARPSRVMLRDIRSVPSSSNETKPLSNSASILGDSNNPLKM